METRELAPLQGLSAASDRGDCGDRGDRDECAPEINDIDALVTALENATFDHALTGHESAWVYRKLARSDLMDAIKAALNC